MVRPIDPKVLDAGAEAIAAAARAIDRDYAERVFRTGGIPVDPVTYEPLPLTDDQRLIHDIDSVARRLYSRAVAKVDRQGA